MPLLSSRDCIRGCLKTKRKCVQNESKNETKSFKIFRTNKTDQKVSGDRKLIATKEGILFPCGDYYLNVTELQPEGKRRMNFKDVVAGYNMGDWEVE